jgi:hypothetical protein
MEISSDERVELSIVEHLPPPPSSHNNGDTGGVEVAMEEDHLWPTKDGPLPIFLKVFMYIHFLFFHIVIARLYLSRVLYVSSMFN